ncbi:hypothetical protein MA16_Dca008077 [Dendrobium catenatum]|uniref:Uncharacterized protein n=1 Tax=Dendrobium catenatum TaxID=906689 RepID=A0A2I0WCZ0_9ASPA|nr:hypothetical protein MA16_Dca008077 [Dendrobium catenatum]
MKIPGDLPEWHLSEDLANPIGQVNGNHDLAHSVLHSTKMEVAQLDHEQIEELHTIARKRQLILRLWLGKLG